MTNSITSPAPISIPSGASIDPARAANQLLQGLEDHSGSNLSTSLPNHLAPWYDSQLEFGFTSVPSSPVFDLSAGLGVHFNASHASRILSQDQRSSNSSSVLSERLQSHHSPSGLLPPFQSHSVSSSPAFSSASDIHRLLDHVSPSQMSGDVSHQTAAFESWARQAPFETLSTQKSKSFTQSNHLSQSSSSQLSALSLSQGFRLSSHPACHQIHSYSSSSPSDHPAIHQQPEQLASNESSQSADLSLSEVPAASRKEFEGAFIRTPRSLSPPTFEPASWMSTVFSAPKESVCYDILPEQVNSSSPPPSLSQENAMFMSNSGATDNHSHSESPSWSMSSPDPSASHHSLITNASSSCWSSKASINGIMNDMLASSPSSTTAPSPFTPTSPFAPWSKLDSEASPDPGTFNQPSRHSSSEIKDDNGFAADLWKLYGPSDQRFPPCGDALGNLVRQLKELGLDVNRIRQHWCDWKHSGTQLKNQHPQAPNRAGSGQALPGLRQELEEQERQLKVNPKLASREVRQPSNLQGGLAAPEQQVRNTVNGSGIERGRNFERLPCQMFTRNQLEHGSAMEIDWALHSRSRSRPSERTIMDWRQGSRSRSRATGFQLPSRPGRDALLNSSLPRAAHKFEHGNGNEPERLVENPGASRMDSGHFLPSDVDSCRQLPISSNVSFTDGLIQDLLESYRVRSLGRPEPVNFVAVDDYLPTDQQSLVGSVSNFDSIDFPMKCLQSSTLGSIPGLNEDFAKLANAHAEYGSLPRLVRKTSFDETLAQHLQKPNAGGTQGTSLASSGVVNPAVSMLGNNLQDLIDLNKAAGFTQEHRPSTSSDKSSFEGLNTKSLDLDDWPHSTEGSNLDWKTEILDSRSPAIRLADQHAASNSIHAFHGEPVSMAIAVMHSHMNPGDAKWSTHSCSSSRSTESGEVAAKMDSDEETLSRNQGAGSISEGSDESHNSRKTVTKKQNNSQGDRGGHTFQKGECQRSQISKRGKANKFSGGKSVQSSSIGEARKRIKQLPYSSPWDAVSNQNPCALNSSGNCDREDSCGTHSTSGNKAGGSRTQCLNCKTQETPLWRRDAEGRPLCNACGLFANLHGIPRPAALSTGIIKRRNRVKAGEKDKSNSKTTDKEAVASRVSVGGSGTTNNTALKEEC